MDGTAEQRLILEMISSGRITATEGLELLQALGEETLEEPGDEQIEQPETHSQDQLIQDPFPGQERLDIPDFDRYRRYWAYPLWVGVIILVLGASLMFWAQQTAGYRWGFVFASLLFAAGVLATVVGIGARQAPWLHLRVLQSHGRGEWPPQIVLAFPLPVGIAIWIVRTFHPTFRDLNQAELVDTLDMLRTARSDDHPIFIEVDDDEDGERIQLFIG